MKPILITTCLFFILINGYSQETQTTKNLAAKFVSYYNADQADSLYSLCSDEVKKSLPASSVPAIISQLKNQLGKLLSTEFTSADKGITTYICPFEKSGPVLYLHFDQNNKLAGFYVNVDKRQQIPLKDTEQLVTITTTSSELKGTLSVPKVSVKIPVVLLIAGSGPTDRNGNSSLIKGKSNYFLKISDELYANKIAVLRYDKRGIGQSTTTESEINTKFEDMVDDAAALIKFLKKDSRFSKVIVAGHSEGSLIGMLASEREKADGFISLAGAGFPITEIIKSQYKEVLSADDYKSASAVLDTIEAGKPVRQQLKNGLEIQFRSSILPYLNSWMKYNPQTVVSKLTMPVLIVQGTHDIQVNVENARQLKKANPGAKLVLIEGMSHILKEGPVDRQLNIATYSNDDLALHPKLVPELEQFINGIK
ncbi:alpha/beta hydrolase fold protein [Arcticibacter svalbardensis MN12-7]|uniref:Alpha/beta hydrolase fold protein n=1 Tax=Arcticibacter svalbardensis MN12-7 TaxID=1150600 RepID=R9GRJ8_9SPHI|nr:alpha/beta fold hydrolase [Arcticibacter svalbardensis]EOR94323.1 alpha/beta hydrolase fold protein [Arcticibacter svalbardensis MN12-7]